MQAKNLFPIRVSDGDSYTVGIDWSHVGIANLGIDIGHLLASPLKWREITPDEARSLRDPVFDAYLAGLVEAGWTGNHDTIRLTYLTRIACEAIRETNLVSESIKREGWVQVLEKTFKHSINDICARFSANLEFQIACKEEAVQLAKRL
jgi:hypothetical protein